MGAELNTTQIALLEAIKASLFGTEPTYPADIDWAEVVKEAKAQTVLGIVSPVIPVKDVSVEMGKAKYMKLLFEQDKLIKLLDANDIPCVILKGSAAAQYYPKPYLRAMGDVDFLVSRDKFDEASIILEANNYKYKYGKGADGKRPENERHFGYSKNGVSFEMHHHFSSTGFDVDEILEKAINKRVYRQIDGYKIPMLPDIENGLVLLGHIHQHLSLDHLGLRQIIDWEMFIDRALKDSKEYDEFTDLLKQLKKKRFADNITLMCVDYFGLLFDRSSLDETDEENAGLLLNMLFDNGNFGIKTTSLSNNRSVSFGIYQIKRQGLFSYFQDLGLKRWKLCRTHTVLRHFAWIYGICRVIVKGMASVIKNENVKAQINEGNEKYDLFEKLGIEASSITQK